VGDLRGERLTTVSTRASWWAVGLVVGAAVGWLIAESGGIFIGLLFLFPSSIGGDRLRAGIGGALSGAGLAVLGAHGPALDVTTLGAGATLLAGLFATWQAFRRP
jgi:hypothetical protein